MTLTHTDFNFPVIWCTVVFWASSSTIMASLSVRPRMNAKGAICITLVSMYSFSFMAGIARIKELSAYAEQYNRLSEDVILDIVKGEAPKEQKNDGVIIYGINGKPISARTPNPWGRGF